MSRTGGRLLPRAGLLVVAALLSAAWLAPAGAGADVALPVALDATAATDPTTGVAGDVTAGAGLDGSAGTDPTARAADATTGADSSAGTDPTTGTDASAGTDATSGTDASSGVVTARSDPPACRHGDVLARVDPAAPELTLLDWRFRLPQGWRPARLVPVSAAGLGGGGSIAAAALPDLRALVRAASAAGVRLWARSAYRSEATQAATLAAWRRQVGLEAALRSAARPGHSEHQLGTAIDFTSLAGGAPWSGGDWGSTPAGRWMRKNAPRYGWVLSYPRGATASTCFRYEPWHWRWVGRSAAAAIVDAKVPPRVWLWWRVAS